MTLEEILSLTEGVASPYWGPIFLITVAAGVAVVTLVLGQLVRPSYKSDEKLEAYECGNHPTGDAREQIPIRYYTVAMLFLLFDVEAIFLWPWAVKYRFEGALFLVEAGIFMGLVGFGYLYAWSKGAFEWKRL